MKKVVIVESPTKAKTIQKYLGDDYKVIASVGHVRDLAIKGENNLGVDINNRFEPIYQINTNKKNVITKIKNEVENADEVYLATDPDREGEAISWHLAQILDLPLQTTKRLEFHEVTYHAILDALNNPRTVDLNLVQSQETRRILDRIIGFKLSSLLNKKIQSLSAGRVQSVALKLLVDREKEIKNFVPKEYWNLYVAVLDKKNEVELELKKVDNEEVEIKNKDEADKYLARFPNNLLVADIIEEEKAHKSYPPFITSSLQIEASKHFKFSSSQTMKIAQSLYEGVKLSSKKTTGLITYMRTDSIRLDPAFINKCKAKIEEVYGKDYVGVAKVQRSQENVQDAHEAIRPTDIEITPESIKDALSKEQYKLYNLIYYRTLASMMTPRTSLDHKYIFTGNNLEFQLSTSKTTFDGYHAAYKEFEKIVKQNKYEFTKGSEVGVINTRSEQLFTKPPFRYNEARLLKELEDLKIGRPSTYATILDTLKETKRGYTDYSNKTLIPTEQGILTVEQLDKFFNSIINVDYTANMEDKLDKIAHGEFTKVGILDEFYHGFIELYDKADKEMEKVELNKVGELCPKCGKELIYRKGKYGKFIGCSGYPTCDYIRKIEPVIPENAKDCPKCKTGKLIVRRGKTSSFLGCTNYPNCDYTELFKKKYAKK